MEGNYLKYSFEPVAVDKLLIRYRGFGNLTLRTAEAEYNISLPEASEIDLYELVISDDMLCGFEILPHNSNIDFDGFVISGKAEFYDEKAVLIPRYEKTERGVSLLFADLEYNVECDADFVVRNLKTDDIGQLLSTKIYDHVSESLGNSGHNSVDLFIRPVFVEANSAKRVTIKITAPKGNEFNSNPQLYEPLCNPSGGEFLFSQRIMSAVTLTMSYGRFTVEGDLFAIILREETGILFIRGIRDL